MTTQLEFVSRSECPTCGHSDHEEVLSGSYRSPDIQEYFRLFYGGRIELEALEHDEYRLVSCVHCSTLFQTRVLTDAGMQVLYEEWIDPATSREKIESSLNNNPMTFVNLMVRLGSLIDKKTSEANVLDFGCGWGSLLETARTMGYNSVGIEFSPTRLEHLKRRGITCYEDTRSLDQKFDLINCSQVLEHVVNPVEIMTAIKEICVPGAVVRVSTPNANLLPDSFGMSDFAMNGKINHRLNSVIPLEHINGYSPRNLADLVSRAGFTLIRTPGADAMLVNGDLFKTAYRFARSYAKRAAYRLRPLRTTDLYFKA